MESKMLMRHVPLNGKDVLEIGCGDGRLTFQYAVEAKSITGLDPSKGEISNARKAIPKRLASKIRFRVGRGENLQFPDGSFDVVFFSWSLCCTDIPAMGKALDQAWRVLRPEGLLASIQASLHQPFQRGMIDYLMQRNSAPLIIDENDRQARLALRYASLVEKKFDLVAEEEFPIYDYYNTAKGALEDYSAQNGIRFRSLSNETRQKVRDIVTSMKTRRGIRVEQNAVLTTLRKH
jgi:ubiquinone/menaquinone biosynthesis C-methylase UbiE